VRRLEQRRYDLLILDLRILRGSGVAVLQQARALYPDLPVIVVTAYTAAEDVAQALALGVDALLYKPFDIDTLLNTVRTLLRQRTPAEKRLRPLQQMRFGRSLRAAVAGGGRVGGSALRDAYRAGARAARRRALPEREHRYAGAALPHALDGGVDRAATRSTSLKRAWSTRACRSRGDAVDTASAAPDPTPPAATVSAPAGRGQGVRVGGGTITTRHGGGGYRSQRGWRVPRACRTADARRDAPPRSHRHSAKRDA
jgi:CheY-like chemotaxis protein